MTFMNEKDWNDWVKYTQNIVREAKEKQDE